jgi:LysR family transcriptional activator of nhaA
MDWLNYHHLLSFWMVAREGSVQGAGQALHVSPASISVQVKQLERSLGSSLLKRSGRGVKLTEMGLLVANYADTIFSTGRELQEFVKGRSIARHATLRVGVRDVMPKLVAYSLLRPALSLSNPVRLICTEGKMSELVADLLDHKLDLVLSDQALDPQKQLRAHSVCLGRSYVTVVGVQSLAERFTQDFPKALADAPFLLPTPDSMLRLHLDQWFEQLGFHPQINAEFADSAMMKIAAKNGLGLMAVPSIIESDVQQMYQLVPVGQIAGIQENFYGLYPDRQIKHPAVLAIRDHFQAQLPD